MRLRWGEGGMRREWGRVKRRRSDGVGWDGFCVVCDGLALKGADVSLFGIALWKMECFRAGMCRIVLFLSGK